jgi:hypothetical protein
MPPSPPENLCACADVPRAVRVDQSDVVLLLADAPVEPSPVDADDEMFKPVVSPSRTCSMNICCARRFASR